MPIEISEIKPIRRKLGITQSELAKLAGVSQSLIAKTEAGALDPTYTNAKKIFSALESFSSKKEAKAGDIMTDRLVHVSPSDSSADAIKKMKKFEISQMPVLDSNGKAVGIISESILLDAVLNSRTGSIGTIMEDAPPTMSKNSSISAVSDMLRYYPIVIVGEKGKLMGIITKSDLLRKVYNK